MLAITRNALLYRLNEEDEEATVIGGSPEGQQDNPKPLLPASPSRQFSEMSRSDHAGSEQSGLPDKQREREFSSAPLKCSFIDFSSDP
jgi:hypothetical protein